MPGTDDNEFVFGPITQQHLKTINARIEQVGRFLGIPEDQKLLSAKIVDIEVSEETLAEVRALRADNDRLHKENRKLRQKAAAYQAGILKSDD